MSRFLETENGYVNQDHIVCVRRLKGELFADLVNGKTEMLIAPELEGFNIQPCHAGLRAIRWAGHGKEILVEPIVGWDELYNPEVVSGESDDCVGIMYPDGSVISLRDNRYFKKLEHFDYELTNPFAPSPEGFKPEFNSEGDKHHG